MKTHYLLFFAAIILFSCEKDKSDQPDPSSGIYAEAGSVYISSEGNFQSANSTITYYNSLNGEVKEDVFQQANGEPVGDICESMKLINGKLYIVVNNSGKIEVCNPRTMERLNDVGHARTITGLTSPRYILPIGTTKAYVSDLFANHLTIVNTQTDEVTGTITLNGWTEQMLYVNNRVYVTNWYSEYLYIIDPAIDEITDSILIGGTANSILLDKNARIWVLRGGDIANTVDGALIRVDPSTNQVELNIPFTPNSYTTRLAINKTNDMIYFLNGSLWKMSVTDTSIPVSPIITSSGNNFYSLGIDKTNDIIYVGDAIDYLQKGRVYRYQADGTLINSFLAGIIPGDFLFL